MLFSFFGRPFQFGFGMSFTDSMFESMSGLTTTGSTVITGLQDLPESLIMWRALLQGIGGIGIIVTAIAVLPSLKVGGMDLFHMESSDRSEKFMPRISDVALQITLVYLTLIILCAGLYRVTGMNEFEAITMAMTTLSTGGFARTDASFAPYVAGGADMVAMVFMICGSLPFSLFAMTMHGDWKAFLRDPQPTVFLALLGGACLLMTLYVMSRGDAVAVGPEGALRMASFNVISVMSGTGYGTTDFGLWGPFASTLFIILMVLGGTAGSASCGLKTFRVHIAVKACLAHVKRMVRPNRVAPIMYARRPVKPEVLQSVMVYVFLHLVTFAVGTCLLALTGLDAEQAVSGAATTLGCVGPGLGETIGPAGSFQPLPDVTKWIFISLMLLGRLELIAVFVVLSPAFWRR